MSASSALPAASTSVACHPSILSASARWGSQNGWPNMTRLEAISRTTEQLDRCVRERGRLTEQGDRWGVTLGECDWLEELHRLLYEENNMAGLESATMFQPGSYEKCGTSAVPKVAEEIDGRQIARDAIAAARRAHTPTVIRPTPAAELSEQGVCVPERAPQTASEWLNKFGDAPPSAKYCTCPNCAVKRERGEKLLQAAATVTIPQEPRIVRRDALSVGEAAQLGIGGAPTRATTLPEEPAERKKYPVASGFMDYFPDAIAAVSNLSWKGNEQHNPGQPLHWARGKSTDEADTMLRHFLQRGTLDTDGQRHSVKMAWRALALLQKEIESELAQGLK